jgi:hypothetical protein
MVTLRRGGLIRLSLVRLRLWRDTAGDVAHSVVKWEAEDLDEEVNGVAGEVALGPAPVTVFEQQGVVAASSKLSAGRSTSWRPRRWSSGASGAMRAARICSRDRRLVLRERLAAVISPVGLNEDAVDLFELDGADLAAHRFDQGR